MNTMTDLSQIAGPQTRQINCNLHGQQLENGWMGKWFGCQVCAEQQLDIDRKNEIEQQQRDFIKSIGIPSLFAKIGFADYQVSDGKQQRILDRLKKYVNEVKNGSNKNVVLADATGAGKTHLACALLRNLASLGVKSRYVSSADFAAQIRASWDIKTRTKFESEIITNYGNVPVLMIDDMGVNDMLKSDIWSHLFDIRYSQKLPTIITTNLDGKSLAHLLGDRAADRLLPNAIWASCVWSSYRQSVSKMERI